MKKKLSISLVIMLTFIFTAFGLFSMNKAYAAENEDYVVGTSNLNGTKENSAKVGNSLLMPEKGWKRYDDRHDYIKVYNRSGDVREKSGDGYGTKYYGGNYSSLGILENDSRSDIMRFKFKGTKFRILVYSMNGYGDNIKVTIDGKTIDHFNSSTESFKSEASRISCALAYEKVGLEDKDHIVEIEVDPDYSKGKTTCVYIDAIDIDENGELKEYKKVNAESISLDKTALDLLEGSTDKLTAIVLPEDAVNKKVVWSSSDETIATVDQEGNVSAIKVGQADITAKVEGTNLSASCKVIVTEKEIKTESIVLDKTALDLLEGSTDKLTATVLPENAVNKEVIWTSSDESIAKVDENGNVTAIKEGQATITAKVENTDLTATCEVNVTKLVEENKNSAILSISLVNGATKEYDVSMEEVEKFINWFEERSNGNGSSLYAFTKKISPYESVKEYIVHDKIVSFEVREYK